jgi:NADH-quinone oxidoreductase subunit G
MLDQSAILCARCTRFVDEVTKTHELAIFERGNHREVALAPGKTLDNPYAGNAIDICPVGALTSRDRPAPGSGTCRRPGRSAGRANGRNIEVPTARTGSSAQPRHNPDVNQY